jgi:predicted GNAT family acetyltransferase
MNRPEVLVRHNAAAERFEAEVDGEICEASYRLLGRTVTFTHTGVPRRLQGHGIAAALVREALAWARREGLRAVPACSYVQSYLRRHPDEAAP